MNEITVLIPTYNRARMLPDAIASIQKQSVRPASIVVYDDGSTDNTAAIVDRIRSIDSTVTLIRSTTNRGVAFARDRLLSIVKTPIAAWQDSDDLSHPDRLGRQREAMVRDKSALCLCAGLRFRNVPPRPADRIDYPITLANASAMWITAAAPAMDLSHRIAGEDSDWLSRFPVGLSVIPEALYLIRDHPDRIGVWKRDPTVNPDWITRMKGGSE